MLALGWVYLCCHSGLSTLYWPHLPLTLAYVGPMVAYVSLFWPYLPLMLAHVDPMRTYVGAMRHEVGSIYVGPRLVFWPYLPLMLAHVDPMRTYVGAMRPQVGSSHTFFPHAKLFSLGVVSTVSQFEEQNTEQEVVTRAYNIRRRPSSPHGPGQDLLIPPTRVHKNDSSEGPSSYHESTSSIIWPLRPPPNRYILSSFLVIQPGW